MKKSFLVLTVLLLTFQIFASSNDLLIFKTEKVLEKEFSYYVPEFQRPFLIGIAASGASVNQNEYSVAIFYMMVMMNLLAEPPLGSPERTDEEKKQNKKFIKEHSKNILRIMHKANSPVSDIEELLNEIHKK